MARGWPANGRRRVQAHGNIPPCFNDRLRCYGHGSSHGRQPRESRIHRIHAYQVKGHFGFAFDSSLDTIFSQLTAENDLILIPKDWRRRQDLKLPWNKIGAAYPCTLIQNIYSGHSRNISHALVACHYSFGIGIDIAMARHRFAAVLKHIVKQPLSNACLKIYRIQASYRHC